MKNLFTFKKDLWESLTLSNPTLLSEATMQKIDAITYYLDGELHSECKLSSEVIAEIKTLFITKVWHYKDEEDFELPIEIMLSLLLESLEVICRGHNHPEEEIASIVSNIKELLCYIPESFSIHESKIRALVIHSYIVGQLTDMGCPYEVAYQIVPPHKEIERRLMLDTFNCDNN